VAVTRGFVLFCTMHPRKNSRFSVTALICSLVASGTTLPVYAASDSIFGRSTLVGVVGWLLLLIAALVGSAGLFILIGHYGFKANPIIAERICYSLGVIVVVKAASESRLSATTSTILALVASLLTYYLLSRLKPNR
jgi:hypothetical protein